MAGKKLRSIREYLFRNGRYLDIARWNYHFENGSESEVLKALTVYQNLDGGFGHGLEPDLQNPNSNPIATWYAIQILRELNFPKLGSMIVEKIIDYLESSINIETKKWDAVIPSNNEYPHAPWWHYSEELDQSWYNPTAEFLGFIIRFADENSKIYGLALESLNQMLGVIMEENYEIEPHELVNVLNLYRDLIASKKIELVPGDFEKFIKEKVNLAIDRDESAYVEENYYTPPSSYINSKDDFTYAGNEEISRFYTEYIEDHVTEFGFWEINWDWNEDEMPENVIRDWTGIITVNNMLFIELIVK